MLKAILAFCFRILGASAMAIGGSNFVFGIAFTARLIDTALQILGMAPSPLAEFSIASVDSEFRFYSVFWFAYGALLWQSAGRLETGLARAGWLIALFALSGVGRVTSYLVYGTPAPLFVLLTWIEIVLTLLMSAIWLKLVADNKVAKG